MQGFSYSEASNDIPLTEDEVKALVALHAKRHEVRSQPSLHDLASALSISDAEAMSLLTELRAQNAPRMAVPPTMPMPVRTPQHKVPAYVWAVAAAVVLFWALIGSLFFVRASAVHRIESVPPMPVEFATKAAPAVPDSPTAPSTGTATAEVRGQSITITGNGD